MNKFYLVILLSLIFTSVTHAYTISPKKDIHESITRSAKQCFDRHANSNTSKFVCDQLLKNDDENINTAWVIDSSFKYINLRKLYKRARGYTASYPTLEDAVKWPDDPTRQIKSAGIGKFSANMISKCKNYVKDNRSGRNDINDGLLCNSHNGEMQFFHSQASSKNELGLDTYFKITSWATFLYKVASGHLSDSQLDQPYCSYFSEKNKFHIAMLPNQHAIPCESKKDPKWSLTTLFTLKCRNPFSSKGCKEEGGPSKYVKARIYAAGALLHLIQDSFSQSHAERGSCNRSTKNNKVVAKIECLPITMYTTYKGQSNHDDADRIPKFAQSCKSSSIDDPVTASAKVLWHINKQSEIKAFRADINKVFGTKEWVRKNVRNSGLGKCFGGDA